MTDEESTVRVGTSVRIRDAEGEDEFILVGPDDSDPIQGRLSTESPLGEALLGRHAGDQVQVHTSAGTRLVDVVAIVARMETLVGR